ncbi:cation-transporting ATPase 13A3 [Biomphalaria glabrata]|uniref:Cation-transporting ATPase n=1 Tax=Biomphalaria glabrata TaxID=6526 RepID=A0A9W2YMW5_BIOGL|nr:polyamine-transporting ATPase 13A3-like [Biomphalaria glabrata]XP_013085043.2 polyamine-transporting ATPase 13A3-like [Biomphalaria glabrata]XP_013085044.2 polyamine-transporting ATPase 13A3-like [Biomphalaria glabrata]XP_055863988.1 polyamine-transporting ATPase 13A3-like [Biomphalaria glabrata]XP_055863989.1 polyamine-transporting ATPase 13A3-like [Biomphalaria glabrata]XP_055863990.1 polyamine-transporting ATPase 13A3-like [Biomphalaria glabrata]XP_055863991.1 polyamine-transporting ATP
MKEPVHYVNKGLEDEMEISAYKLKRIKLYATFVGYVLTCGILRLVFYWLPHWMLKATHSPCPLVKAEQIMLKDAYNMYYVVTVKTMTREGTGVKVRKPKRKLFRKPQQYDDTNNTPENDDSLLRYFVCKRVKYVWDSESASYIPLRGLDIGCRQSYFHNITGLTIAEQSKRRVLYGSNVIDVHVTPIIIILFKELASPFYTFQLFSVCLWFAENYWIYAVCIIVITVISLIIQIYQTRQFERALRNTITSTDNTIVMRANESFENIPASELAPGDIIEIPRFGCDMQCDAVLITGNCIVNESMLTGESVPVTKTSLPNTNGMRLENDPEVTVKTHSRHILFCGTHVIQTRFYGNQKVKAVVLRTGFSTSKGELVRSIMYPKPLDFKFQRHALYYIGILALIALCGMIYTLVLKIDRKDPDSEIVIRVLDLITIIIPPALPAALAVGMVFSQRRLKFKNIYCISPRSLNICGTIDAVCFDKTGTLTEDGLNMHGVVRAEKNKFESILKDMSQLPKDDLFFCMACCHSLTIIDNEIIGDPMDIIMFKATNWDLEEPGPDETRFDMMTPTIVHPKVDKSSSSIGTLSGLDIGIVRQFPFSSSLQRMSVVTRRLGAKNFDLYVKGSPEMITSLSKTETIPHDFQEVLQSYTKHGYRVIALAWKELSSKLNLVKIQRLNREQVENELNFLGLLVMENHLKPQSTPAINELKDANIRTIMVTGDNMLTALSVARECNMVEKSDRIILVQAYPPDVDHSDVTFDFVYADDKNTKVDEAFTLEDQKKIHIDLDNPRFHFAVTGKTWAVLRKYCPDILRKIAVKGTVFARMGPDQKGQLVEVLQDIGYSVGMCGDGANDCGALKTAHMGISLSEAEASVASPFTSKTPNIECVPTVIKEGRCSLVTAFGVFKYMACYSMTQFISVLILYWKNCNLSNDEFLYADIFLTSTYSITFSRTAPYEELVVDRPLISLISPGPILSLITQVCLVTAFQVFVYFHVQMQPWFIGFRSNLENDYTSHENSAVFIMSMYQYTILAIVFAKGYPYRKAFFTNWWFVLNLIITLAITMWLTIDPDKDLASHFQLAILPSIKYRSMYIGIAFIQLVLAYSVEKFIIDNDVLRRKISNCLKNCIPSHNLVYNTIESEIDNDPDWPPVSDKQVDLAEIFQRQDNVQQDTHNLEEMRNSLEDVLGKDFNDDISQTDESAQMLLNGSPGATSRSNSAIDNPAFMDDSMGYSTAL